MMFTNFEIISALCLACKFFQCESPPLNEACDALDQLDNNGKLNNQGENPNQNSVLDLTGDSLVPMTAQ